MSFWQTIGKYEYEVAADEHGCNLRYTGWCRCVGGRCADDRWPQWNSKTGERR